MYGGAELLNIEFKRYGTDETGIREQSRKNTCFGWGS